MSKKKNPLVKNIMMRLPSYLFLVLAFSWISEAKIQHEKQQTSLRAKGFTCGVTFPTGGFRNKVCNDLQKLDSQGISLTQIHLSFAQTNTHTHTHINMYIHRRHRRIQFKSGQKCERQMVQVRCFQDRFG